jgi:heme/copper-type cytochrome/quinol oxidase subunit 2
MLANILSRKTDFTVQVYELFKGVYYPFSTTLQEPAGFYAYGVVRFYSLLVAIMIFVAIMVFILLFAIYFIYGENFFKFNSNNELYFDIGSQFNKHDLLEWVWSLLPLTILIGLVYPSFALLYAAERYPENFEYSVIVNGQQWFWSYEVSYLSETLEVVTTSWESKLVGSGINYKTSTFENSYIYLLETNKSLILPSNKYIQILVTATDVIHSWALPSLGLKLDAVPGRLNQLITLFKKPGVFFGQCSELCGVGHSLMPIAVIITA